MNKNLTNIATYIVYLLIAILILFIAYSILISLDLNFKTTPKNSFKVQINLLNLF